jgi:hypothetical protein
MGQVLGTLGISNALLGQLYCKRSASISEIAVHYAKSSNRLYFKTTKTDDDDDEGDDEGDDSWPANHLLFELFLLYHWPSSLHLGPEHAKPSWKLNSFYEEIRKANFSPIITAASFPSREHELLWAQLHTDEVRDSWSGEQYKVFETLPLRFSPGWRMLIKIIPRVHSWRPDEWWTMYNT